MFRAWASVSPRKPATPLPINFLFHLTPFSSSQTLHLLRKFLNAPEDISTNSTSEYLIVDPLRPPSNLSEKRSFPVSFAYGLFPHVIGIFHPTTLFRVSDVSFPPRQYSFSGFSCLGVADRSPCDKPPLVPDAMMSKMVSGFFSFIGLRPLLSDRDFLMV